MIPLRASQLIDAPEGAVRRVLGRTDVWTRTVRALGLRADVAAERADPRAPLRTGDLIRVRSGSVRSGSMRSGSMRSGWLRPRWSVGWSHDLWPSRSVILRVTVDPQGLPVLDLVAGPLEQCRVSLTVVPTGAGTLVTIDCRVLASPPALTPLLRRRVLAAAQLLLGVAVLAAREQVVVVAGAIIENGRVLAARRAGPAELAGKWELPGGKVEPGETDQQALRRELAEEFGIDVIVSGRIGSDVDLGDSSSLRCYRVALTTGRPAPTEHDATRWLAADGLDELDWLPADRQMLAEVRRVLLDHPGDQ